MLIKEPQTISLGAVLRLVDGPMAPLPCLSRRAYQRCDDCRDEETCRIREVFGSVFAELPAADRVADARRPHAGRSAALDRLAAEPVLQ